jgi:hypothetical protein
MSLIFVQCKKEEPANQTKPEVLTDAMVTAKIKAFNERLKNVTKTDAPMAIDDAVWNIEAALNYNFCRADLPQNNDYRDSLFIEIPVVNGMLAFSDIANAYQQAAEKLQSMLKSTTTHAVVVDVMALKQENNALKTKITFIISDEKESNSAKDVEYHTAATQIKNYINSNMVPLPQGWYYTNIETAYDCGPTGIYSQGCLNPNWDGQYENYYRYLMFFNEDNYPSYHTYLNSTEMSFYQSGTITFMNMYTTSYGPRPVGKRAISITLIGDAIYAGDYTIIIHHGDFTYGIPHSGGGE